jgi:hypothetical protein
MVDVLGHLGMALLWLAPVWYFVDQRKTAALVVAGGFWFGMLPDIDLRLSEWVEGIHHHGVIHTILVVTILAVIIGPIVGVAFRRIGERTGWFSAQAQERATAIGFLAVWIPSLSHLFADMLSAPDVSTQIEPLWPIVTGPVVAVDVLWYQSWWATWGLFILGVTANVLAWYRTSDRRQPNNSTGSAE